MRATLLAASLAAVAVSTQTLLLPTRIVENISLRPLRVSGKIQTMHVPYLRKLHARRLEGFIYFSPAGFFEVQLDGGDKVRGEWTMMPSGHEILDRVWDTIRLDASVGDVRLQCTARLYARDDRMHSRLPLTSHATVLAWRKGQIRYFFRPVVGTLLVRAP